VLNSRCLQDGISWQKSWEGIQFVSRIFRFWAGSSTSFLLYGASIFALAAVNEPVPSWMDGELMGFLFMSLCEARQLADWLYFLTLSQPWSQFLFWNFSFSPPNIQVFFSPFETPPPTYLLSPTYPTHPHLPTHLYI
jgi:hypothetical protein